VLSFFYTFKITRRRRKKKEKREKGKERKKSSKRKKQTKEGRKFIRWCLVFGVAEL
jgi:hypothetical protein